MQQQFEIIFYETKNGEVPVWEFLEALRAKSASSKDARIQYKQATTYIELLAKYLDDDVWELRPGKNRIFFFFASTDGYVLLHQFRKKTQKTPKKEIERAKRERTDYLIRKENGKFYEDLE